MVWVGWAVPYYGLHVDMGVVVAERKSGLYLDTRVTSEYIYLCVGPTDLYPKRWEPHMCGAWIMSQT